MTAAAADELHALYPALRGSTRVSKVGEGTELHLYRVGPGESCVLTSSCLVGSSDYPASGG